MIKADTCLAVLGDSHGHMPSLLAVLPELSKADWVLHTGDFLRDSKFLAEKLAVPVIGVTGNGDREVEPTDEIVEIAGRRIFITHGHLFGVKNTMSALTRAGVKRRADIVVFGHTHVPTEFHREGILFVNPGSIFSGRRGHGRSYAIITLLSEAVRVEFVSNF